LIAAAAVLVVALVVGLIWRIHSSRHPAETSTVYAGELAPVAIAVTVLMALGAAWRKSRRGAAQVTTLAQAIAAADRLAEVIADRWKVEASARRIVTPAPAAVRWRWAAEEITAPRPDVITLPVPGTGPAPLPDLGGLPRAGPCRFARHCQRAPAQFMTVLDGRVKVRISTSEALGRL
jgi:hypothetical protein